MSKKNHRGGDFRDFLNEQGILGEVETRALKQALSLQLDQLLKKQELTKTQMGFTDENQPSRCGSVAGCLQFLGHAEHARKAARALGRKVKIELVPV